MRCEMTDVFGCFPGSATCLSIGLQKARVLVLALGITACGGGERQLTGPDGAGPDSFNSLTVHLALEPSDSELADALGWAEGVPHTEVHLLRNGSATWEVATVDAKGELALDGLLPGRYLLYAGRRPTAEEAVSLGQMRAFGGGRTFDLVGDAEIDLLLGSDRASGLVISEVNGATPPPWEVDGSYYDGLYIEIFNNSVTTRFLDGLVIGVAYPYGTYDSDHTPCSVSQTVRSDPSGLFTRWAIAFPGAGGEHPIQPGEARVVAISAINHTPVHPELVDLSGADFEIGGGRNADNPAVPNMLQRGLEPWYASFFLPVNSILFLSDPIDLQSQPIAFRGTDGSGYVRAVAEGLHDVTAFKAIWPDRNLEYPPCIPMVHSSFDRYEGGLFEIGFGVSDPTQSLQRVLLRIDGGRPVLDTNTSAVDFVFAEQTPGRIP